VIGAPGGVSICVPNEDSIIAPGEGTRSPPREESTRGPGEGLTDAPGYRSQQAHPVTRVKLTMLSTPNILISWIHAE